MNNIPLEQVFNCKDLWVFFDSKLSYNTYINYIKNKHFKLFGFIQFSFSNFNNLKLLCLTYCSFMRSTLEHCSIICSPLLQKYNLILEASQNKCLGFHRYHCNIPYIPHTSYGPILTFLSLGSLDQT